MADFRYFLAIYVHAHQTGNSVPPHIDAEARAALDAPPAEEGPVPLKMRSDWIAGYREGLADGLADMRRVGEHRQPEPPTVPPPVEGEWG